MPPRNPFIFMALTVASILFVDWPTFF